MRGYFSLNSAFCFILRSPYPTTGEDGTKGRVYLWLGSKSDPYYHAIAKEVAEELISADDQYLVETINEGIRWTKTRFGLCLFQCV